MRTIHLVRCSWHPAGCETRRTPNLRWSRVGLLRCYRRRAGCNPRRCSSESGCTSPDSQPARLPAGSPRVAHGWFRSCCLSECHAFVDGAGSFHVALAVVGGFGDTAVLDRIPHFGAVHSLRLPWQAQRSAQVVHADAVAGAGPLNHGVKHNVGIPWPGIVRPPDRRLDAQDDGSVPDEAEVKTCMVVPNDAGARHVVAAEVHFHLREGTLQDRCFPRGIVRFPHGNRLLVTEGPSEHGDLPATTVERRFAPCRLCHVQRLHLSEAGLPSGDHGVLGRKLDLRPYLLARILLLLKASRTCSTSTR